MDTIDVYLENLFLQDQNTFEFITEAESKLRQLISKISNIKKPQGKDKEEAKKELQDKKDDPRYKKIFRVIKNYSEDVKAGKKIEKTKLKKDLEDVLGYASSYLIGSIFPIVMTFIIYGKMMKYAIPIQAISIFVLILSDLPAPIIAKLVTKTEKSTQDILKDINQSTLIQNINTAIGILEFISAVVIISLGSSVLIWASVISICLSLARIVIGIIIGIKTNNWSVYLKNSKESEKIAVGESIEYTFKENIDSLVFLSSLRESLIGTLKDKNSKLFILDSATDYEILYFTIEGKFPEKSNGNCDILIDLLGGVLGECFIEPRISSNGLLGSMLSETINRNVLYKETFLSEATVNPKTLEELNKLKKEARKDMFKYHPDHYPGYKDMSQTEKEKINKMSQDAADRLKRSGERYDTYKRTGVDPGLKSKRGSSFKQSTSSWVDKFTTKLQFPGIQIKNALGKIKGASELADKLKINPALAGGFIVLSGAAAAALLIVLSYKLYYRISSDAAKECKGTSYKAKTACMIAFEIKATKERINDLSKAKDYCLKLAKEEQKSCSQALIGKIEYLNDELKKMEKELTDLRKAA